MTKLTAADVTPELRREVLRLADWIRATQDVHRAREVFGPEVRKVVFEYTEYNDEGGTYKCVDSVTAFGPDGEPMAPTVGFLLQGEYVQTCDRPSAEDAHAAQNDPSSLDFSTRRDIAEYMYQQWSGDIADDFWVTQVPTFFETKLIRS